MTNSKSPFVIDDPSTFLKQAPIMLGMLMVNQVVQAMKESDFDNALPEWQGSQAAYEWGNETIPC